MRVPGRKIWRAFKELDQFSDEQCTRFVKRAYGGPFFRLLISAFVFGVFAVTFLGLLTVMLWAHTALELDNRSKYSDAAITWTTAAGVLIVGFTAPMLALLVRDFILRSAIWRVLNLGGVCRNCHYPLHGLPLSEALECTCPECSALTVVDPALVELARNSAGQTIAVRRGAQHDVRQFWTPRRLRLAKRATLWTFLMLFVFPFVVLGLNELMVRIEAARAAARIPTFQQFRDLIPDLKPGPPVDDVKERGGAFLAAAQIQLAWEEQSKAYVREAASAPDWTGAQWYAAESLMQVPVDPGEAAPPQVREAYVQAARNYEVARAILARVEAAGALASFGELARDPRNESALFWDRESGEWGTFLYDSFAGCRAIAMERLRRSAAIGDREQADVSMRAVLNTLRLDYARPGWSSTWGVGYSEPALWDELLSVCHAHPELIDLLENAVRDIPIQPDWPRAMRVEKLRDRDFVLRILSDPALVRFNRFTPALQTRIVGPAGLLPGRIGWVDENIAASDAGYDNLIALLEAKPFARPSVQPAKQGLLLVTNRPSATQWILPALDLALARRASIPVILAIDRFRRDFGRPPETLDDPALRLRASDLVDPLSGQAWVYLVRPPAGSKLKPRNGYLLYSRSLDCNDDFARTADDTIFIPANTRRGAPALEGRDVLLNPGP